MENIWRTDLAPWPRVKYFSIRPSHFVNKYIVCNETKRKAIHSLTPRAWNNLFDCIRPYFRSLEQFSIECSKTKTKAITLANHNSRKIHVAGAKRGKMRASKLRLVLQSAGKCVRASQDCFCFYFWLVEIFLANYKAKQCKTKAIAELFSTLIEKRSVNFFIYQQHHALNGCHC